MLIPPDSSRRKGTRPGWDGGLYAFMRRVLATERGGELYGKRQPIIEPVFGHTKFNRGIDRFHRRGRAAVRTEWRLITATHNLLKLYRHTTARCRPEAPAGRPRTSRRNPPHPHRSGRHDGATFTRQPRTVAGAGRAYAAESLAGGRAASR